MKKISVLILFLSMCFFVNAQTKQETEVKLAVENLRLAMISGERTALEHIVSDNLNYGHSGGKIQNKAAFVESFVNGSSDFVTIDLSNQTIEVIGKIALVRHQLNATTNDGGKPAEVKLGVFLVWHKEGKQWKLLARQAFKH